MLERSLDEFEAIFERATIPVLDIRELALTRLSAVLKGDPLDASIVALASYMQQRFGAEVQVHWPAGREAVLEPARAAGLTPAERPFASTAELVGQVAIGRRQLILVCEPADEGQRLLDVAALIQGTAPPVLLVRRPIAQPEEVFRRILHSLTGNFRQTQNFSYSFTLVENAGGSLLLLHTIDESDLADVRQALRVSPHVPADGRQELLAGLSKQGERYLKAVVAASRKYPYEVTYRLALGEVVPTVQEELRRGGHTLLVVGHHREGHSFIEAADYELMHEVLDIPVLAL